jgi:hypothetical protein
MHPLVKEALRILRKNKNNARNYYDVPYFSMIGETRLEFPCLAISFQTIKLIHRIEMGIKEEIISRELLGFIQLIAYLRLFYPEAFKIWANKPPF